MFFLIHNHTNAHTEAIYHQYNISSKITAHIKIIPLVPVISFIAFGLLVLIQDPIKDYALHLVVMALRLL